MLTIIDYGVGNIASIANMLKRIGVPSIKSSRHADIEKAGGLIIPGVGSFDAAVRNLKTRNLFPLLRHKALEEKVPILGICLGMQLLGNTSEEGVEQGLGWVNVNCERFEFEQDSKLKIPCMGWNQIRFQNTNPLFKGLDNPRFYFVHSYHVVCRDAGNSIATAEYGYEYTVALQKDNIYGVQFHPEKSHKYGMQLFKNFSEMCT